MVFHASTATVAMTSKAAIPALKQHKTKRKEKKEKEKERERQTKDRVVDGMRWPKKQRATSEWEIAYILFHSLHLILSLSLFHDLIFASQCLALFPFGITQSITGKRMALMTAHIVTSVSPSAGQGVLRYHWCQLHVGDLEVGGDARASEAINKNVSI